MKFRILFRSGKAKREALSPEADRTGEAKLFASTNSGADPRWSALSLSVLLHGVLFAVLQLGSLTIDELENEPAPVLFVREMVFYPVVPKESPLPAVAALENSSTSKLARAPRVTKKQAMVSTPEKRSPARQSVIHPATEPAKPQRQLVRNRVELPPAPAPVKRFELPAPQAAPARERPALMVESLPTVAQTRPAAPPDGFAAPTSIAASKPPLRKAVIPLSPARPVNPAPLLLDHLPDVGLPPAAGTAPPKAGPVQIQAAKPPTASGGSAPTTLAVIGPREGKSDRVPGPQTASFARSENRGEVDPGKAPPGAVRLPNVSVAGNSGPAPPPPAASKPESPAAPVAVIKPRAVTLMYGTAIGLAPGTRKLPSAVETTFSNRKVHIVVIPMRDVPRHGADWTTWFAEESADSGVRGLQPPIPLQKSESNRFMAAEGETSELVFALVRLTISAQGRATVHGLLRPLTPPDFAEFVRADVASWEFRAARRNGVPIDVEVVFEIPYRTPARR